MATTLFSLSLPFKLPLLFMLLCFQSKSFGFSSVTASNHRRLDTATTSFWKRQRKRTLLAFVTKPELSKPNKKVHTTTTAATTTAEVTPPPPPSEENEKKKKGCVEVSTEMELPFSAEVAFDAFSDLPRQPSWSPWLHSVSYIDEALEETKWKLKYMGVTITWNAINTRKERPYIIEWKSTAGLQNFGRVDFLPAASPENTLMRMTMTFVVPGPAARMFRKSGKLKGVVKNRMIMPTLVNFREIVMANDLKGIKVVSESLPVAER
jgi:uncharacterized membrane protein